MARTKQTARRSPYSYAPTDNQATLVDIYKTTQTRTISVDGEVELTNKPDIVDLSFTVCEYGDNVDEAMNKALTKLAAARKGITSSTNISNQDISSDSIQVDEVEVEIPSYDKEESEEEDDSDDKPPATRKRGRGSPAPAPALMGGFGMPTSQFGMIGNRDRSNRKYKKQQQVTIVLRIHLENETVAYFNQVMLETTVHGLQSYSSPVYQSSSINELRQEARKDAIHNAKLRANIIVEGLSDETVALGSPLTITEIPIDVEDDAADSFLPGIRYNRSYEMKDGRLCAQAEVEEESYVVKKARLENLQSVVGDLFVLPDITIGARVRVIFALNVRN